MYKVFLKYPDALKPAFPRLKEKLEDPDPGVQSAAVNVICELARKNPRNYLPLAPVFFKLMTNSTNNWMLIKIIKLVWKLFQKFFTILFVFRSCFTLECLFFMSSSVSWLNLNLFLELNWVILSLQSSEGKLTLSWKCHEPPATAILCLSLHLRFNSFVDTLRSYKHLFDH